MSKILIVEDETGINELIKRTLTATGHQCLQAYNGPEAIDVCDREQIDLMLLDINLTGMSGFQVAKMIADVPIIYVTARDEIHDRVRGLTNGADDYIIKPFAMEELIARVQVVLRRYNKEEKIFHIGNAEVNLEKYEVYLNQKSVSLTKREFELLRTLIVNKNIALSRDKLLDLAWGMDYFGDDRTVDVHIQRLRSKLHLEDYIKTIYKFGYRLEV